MPSRIAGDHYLVLLLPIDPGSTILMDGRDLKVSGDGPAPWLGMRPLVTTSISSTSPSPSKVVFSAEV